MIKARILLIEDEEDLARLFEHALAREGHQIRRAHDAAEGLEAFRRWDPDLILLDVVLPVMSGLEFLKVLRKESRVGVILISGKRRPADVALGSELGADDYLVKPFSLDVLRARVRLALSRAARGRAAPAARRSSPARPRAVRSSPR
ncbi:MAG: response regulator [Elusimicrobia bacterium]|nr:response regulator [Elusimicrobiota bacterium]